jgi:cysteine synthase
MILNHISEAIGNTPILKINESVHCIKNLELYCKLEYMNPFWSLKDRPASYFMEDMRSFPEKTQVIEASSGNTIKALWALAWTYWFAAKTITNRIKVEEQLDMLKILWVDIQQVSTRSECVDFSDSHNPVQLIEQLCSEDAHRYHTDQYRSVRNSQSHYDTTAQEIIHDLWSIDYFFSWLWTTWSSWAITAALTQKNTNLHAIGIVSDPHDFIPGIRTIEEMNEVWIFDTSVYHAIQEVTALDAVEKTIALVRKTWMLCWPTTWAVYHSILSYFSHTPLAKPAKVLFLWCDRIENYFSYIKQRLPSIFHQHHKECILTMSPAQEAQYYQSLDVPTLWQSLDKFLLIDTRSTKSYQLWYIEWSMNIPFETLNELIDKGKVFASNRPIVLLCMQWKKTKRLCSFLNKLWYKAYTLAWWLQQWKKQWRPFTTFVH